MAPSEKKQNAAHVAPVGETMALSEEPTNIPVLVFEDD